MRRLTAACAAIGLGASAIFGAPALAQSKEFAVVGTWGQLDHWKERESKFWNETLPEVSGGELTANAKPLTELGLEGTTVMREVRSGAFDFAHGVFLYISADSPVIEGADLAGVTPDLETFREVMEAYKPVMQDEFERLYNSRILMLYPWPQTHLICAMPEDPPSEVTLDTFKGLKVRSFGSSASDFITETLNAVPVPVAFGEVLPSLQKGALDCGATGVLSAYSAKWYQGANVDVQYSLGYTASFLAVNNDVWVSLTDEQRSLLEEEIGKLEEEMWSSAAQDDTDGMNCLADGPCPKGETGGMRAVSLTDEAEKELRASLEDGVLKNWAQRCEARSEGCAEAWNDTIGEIVGLTAKP